MKGGMHFYRGSGNGAAAYFDEGHGRAEAYYSEGHQATVQIDSWRGGERVATGVLEDRGALATWVEGRDPATGELKGKVRPGGPEREPLALRRGGGQQPEEPVGGGHPGPGGGGGGGTGHGPPGGPESASTCRPWP